MKRISAATGKAGKPAKPEPARRSLESEVRSAVALLKRQATKKTLDGMARYAIPSERAFGVSMADLQRLAKSFGRDHELAEGLWRSGWYEARMLACLVDDPARVTRRQMNTWAAEFDNWAVCDTACFFLFDKTPFAYESACRWAASPREFVKRAAFALMASLAGHDKVAADAKFRAFLPLIEQGARDERNFVKKGVSWALRRIGRRSLTLHAPAIAVAARLADSKDAASRWVGKDAKRELESPKVRSALAGGKTGRKKGEKR